MLQRDAYFTLNTFKSGGRKPSPYAPGLTVGQRRTAALSHLNAAFADLDTYKAGVDVGEAVAQVIRLQDAGEIPPASLMLRSGQGLWLFWLLVDRDTGQPPASDRDTLKLYGQVQRAINARFAPLGADRQAVDPARHARVPGSINSKAPENPVTWWAQLDRSGNAYAYTLAELAARFVKPRQPRPAPPPTGDTDQTRSTREKGKPVDWAEVNARSLRQFRKLWTLRGGFDEGTRHNAGMIYAWLLHLNGHTVDQIAEEVTKLGETCSPPMTESDVRDATAGVGRYRFRTRTIAERLQIRPEEAEQLETWRSSASSPFAAARQAGQKAEGRRSLILTLIEQHGGEVLPLRKMVQLLTGRGERVGKSTVQTDYQALGIG